MVKKHVVEYKQNAHLATGGPGICLTLAKAWLKYFFSSQYVAGDYNNKFWQTAKQSQNLIFLQKEQKEASFSLDEDFFANEVKNFFSGTLLKKELIVSDMQEESGNNGFKDAFEELKQFNRGFVLLIFLNNPNLQQKPVNIGHFICIASKLIDNTNAVLASFDANVGELSFTLPAVDIPKEMIYIQKEFVSNTNNYCNKYKQLQYTTMVDDNQQNHKHLQSLREKNKTPTLDTALINTLLPEEKIFVTGPNTFFPSSKTTTSQDKLDRKMSESISKDSKEEELKISPSKVKTENFSDYYLVVSTKSRFSRARP